MKEDILLVRKSNVNTFSFILNTDGLIPAEDAVGWYLWDGIDVSQQIRLGQVISYDANGDFSIGEMTVTPNGGTTYRITLTVDPTFLEDATYPVTVDPTFTVSDNENGTSVTLGNHSDKLAFRQWSMIQNNAEVDQLYYSDVKVEYDHGYEIRYANALERIQGQLYKTQNYYLGQFGIYFDFETITKINSVADDSIEFVNGSYECSGCISETHTAVGNHHCDYDPYNENIRNHAQNGEDVILAFTGHELCDCSDLTDTDDYGGVYGVHFSNGDNANVCIVGNRDGEKQELKTLIHEFGHIFDAPDHYYSEEEIDIGEEKYSTTTIRVAYEDETFSESCIYGENKDDNIVVNQLLICSGCKTVMQNYIDSINNQGE